MRIGIFKFGHIGVTEKKDKGRRRPPERRREEKGPCKRAIDRRRKITYRGSEREARGLEQ
jgi:hypothetical protein